MPRLGTLSSLWSYSFQPPPQIFPPQQAHTEDQGYRHQRFQSPRPGINVHDSAQRTTSAPAAGPLPGRERLHQRQPMGKAEPELGYSHHCYLCNHSVQHKMKYMVNHLVNTRTGLAHKASTRGESRLYVCSGQLKAIVAEYLTATWLLFKLSKGIWGLVARTTGRRARGWAGSWEAKTCGWLLIATSGTFRYFQHASTGMSFPHQLSCREIHKFFCFAQPVLLSTLEPLFFPLKAERKIRKIHHSVLLTLPLW